MTAAVETSEPAGEQLGRFDDLMNESNGAADDDGCVVAPHRTRPPGGPLPPRGFSTRFSSEANSSPAPTNNDSAPRASVPG